MKDIYNPSNEIDDKKSQKVEKTINSQEVDETINSIRGKIAHQQQIPDSLAYPIENIQNSIQQVKEAGVDVSDFEAQIPELNKKMLRASAEKKIAVQQQNPDSLAYSIETIQNSIQQAKEAGVDVSDLEAQIPKLKKKMESKS